ncbi:MAG: hypothetical protein FJ224_09345, partial [Lentisphaerae bacterium]|nr:hypothetical protein [Lentisphaerota bacterium]
GTNAFTFSSGVIRGTGTVSVSGYPTAVFAVTNAWTGPTYITGGMLATKAPSSQNAPGNPFGASSTFAGNGTRLAAYDRFGSFVGFENRLLNYAGSEILLDNSLLGSPGNGSRYRGASGQGRWGDTATITLRGSSLLVRGGNMTAVLTPLDENVGAISLNALSAVTISPATTRGGVSITADRLVRNGRAVLAAGVTGLDSADTGSVLHLSVERPPASSNGMLPPWILITNSMAFALYDNDNSDGYVGIAPKPFTATSLSSALPEDVVRISSSVTAASNRTAHALSVSGTDVTLNLGAKTLTLQGAGIILNGAGTTIQNGTIALGSAEAMVWSNPGTDNSSTLGANLTGTGGLTVTLMNGTLRLNGSSTAMSGPLSVWGPGKLQVTSPTGFVYARGLTQLRLGQGTVLDMDSHVGLNPVVGDLSGSGTFTDSSAPYGPEMTLSITNSLSPGISGPGTLTLDSVYVTLNSGITANFDLGPAGSAFNDLVRVTGGAGGAGDFKFSGPIRVRINELDSTPRLRAGTRTLFEYSGRLVDIGNSSVTGSVVTVGYGSGLKGRLVKSTPGRVDVVLEPSGAPVIFNSPATSVQQTSARMNATLSTTGTASTAVFVYWGETDAGTNRAAWARTNRFGFVSNTGPLGTNITSLAAGRTYYYTFLATNRHGMAWPESRESFTTVGKPVIQNTGATNVTTSSATLTGYLSSTGLARTAVFVNWGKSDGGDNVSAWSRTNLVSTDAGPGVCLLPVSGLDDESTYYYRFRATNSLGSSWATPTAEFLTLDGDPRIENGSVSNITYDSAYASGKLVSTGAAPASVTVYWGSSYGGSDPNLWERKHDLGPKNEGETFSALLDGLKANTTYYWRYRAVNSQGDHWAAGMPSFTTLADVPGPELWPHEARITFPGYDRSVVLTNFPVMVPLDASIPGFSYADFVSSSGRDLRFATDGDFVEIPHEIESWNPAWKSFVWVKVPRLTAGTVIWAHWGNPLDDYTPATSTNGAVWSEGFSGVWHMNASGTANRPDSTANRNSAATVTYEGNENSASLGAVNGADALDGSDSLSVPDAPSLRPTSITVEGWFKPDRQLDSMTATFPMILSKEDFANKRGFLLGNAGSAADDMTFRILGGTTANSTYYTETGSGQWLYVAGTYDGRYQRIFRNGVQAAVNDRGVFVMQHNATALTLGSGMEAMLDELRVSNTARSTNWIWATWANISSSSTFVSATVPADSRPVVSAVAPTNITLTAALLRGYLVSTGNSETAVTVYWGPTDGVVSPDAWSNSASVAHSGPGAISRAVSDLVPGRAYYYRFRAGNSAGYAWSAPAESFITSGGPSITSDGVTNTAANSAWLTGDLVSTGAAPTRVFLYWGPTDGGSDHGAWENRIDLGARSPGNFSYNLTNWYSGAINYYRLFATNSYRGTWAPSSHNWTFAGIWVPFLEDWETGTFRSFWNRESSANPPEAWITTDFGSFDGVNHVVLARPQGVTNEFKRNTIRLGPIDITGKTNLWLTYSAKSLGDEPHVSNGSSPIWGISWPTVQDVLTLRLTTANAHHRCRMLTAEHSGIDLDYKTFAVNINSEIALASNYSNIWNNATNIYVYFNQYDNYNPYDLVRPDGLAFDNIRVFVSTNTPVAAQFPFEDSFEYTTLQPFYQYRGAKASDGTGGSVSPSGALLVDSTQPYVTAYDGSRVLGVLKDKGSGILDLPLDMAGRSNVCIVFSHRLNTGNTGGQMPPRFTGHTGNVVGLAASSNYRDFWKLKGLSPAENATSDWKSHFISLDNHVHRNPGLSFNSAMVLRFHAYTQNLPDEYRGHLFDAIRIVNGPVISAPPLSAIERKTMTPVQFSAAGGADPYDFSSDVYSYRVTRAASSYAQVGTRQKWWGEDTSFTVNLPFDFPYTGRMHRQLFVDTNGRVTFDVPTSDPAPTPAKAWDMERAIFVIWNNINTYCDATSDPYDIYIQTNATSATILWRGRYTGTTNPVNASITLNNDGSFRLKYGAGNANGGYIGASSFSGSNTERWTGDSLANAQDYIFTPDIGLPPGVALSRSGLLSGTPLLSGTNRFIVNATDNDGIIGSSIRTMVISKGVDIASRALPVGTQLVSYAVTPLKATNGVPAYSWSLETTYGEQSSSNTFSATGTAKGWKADDFTWNLNLPITFPFYGRNYTNCLIDSNGRIVFEASGSGYDPSNPQESLEALKAERMIAVLWDDLTTLGSGNIYVSSDAESVTIRWNGRYFDGGAVNFAARLWNSGRITLRYGDGNLRGGMIGVSAGESGLYALSARSGTSSMSNADDIVFNEVTGGYASSSDGRSWPGLSVWGNQGRYVRLPFAFPFYGRSYQDIWIEETGAIFLDPFSGVAPSTAAFDSRRMIAVFWTRFDNNNARNILSGAWSDMMVSDDLDSATITWHTRSEGAPYSHSVTLDRNGNVRMRYGRGNTWSDKTLDWQKRLIVGISGGNATDQSKYIDTSTDNLNWNLHADIVFTNTALKTYARYEQPSTWVSFASDQGGSPYFYRPIKLPFEFPFYGNIHTQAFVDSYGRVFLEQPRMQASDSPTNTVYQPYPAGWTSGDNGGFGMGAWTLNAVAPAVADIITTNELGTTWHLYSEKGSFATATRQFADALNVNDMVTLRMDIDTFLDNDLDGSRAGFRLLNEAGQELVRFEAYEKGNLNRHYYTSNGVPYQVRFSTNLTFNAARPSYMALRMLSDDRCEITASCPVRSPLHQFRITVPFGNTGPVKGIELYSRASDTANDRRGHIYFRDLAVHDSTYIADTLALPVPAIVPLGYPHGSFGASSFFDVMAHTNSRVATFRWHGNLFTGNYNPPDRPVKFSTTLYPDGRIRMRYGDSNTPTVSDANRDGGRIGISNGGIERDQHPLTYSGSMHAANDILYRNVGIPDDMNVSASGVLSGTPFVPVRRGFLPFSVQDQQGSVDRRELTLEVKQNPNRPPRILSTTPAAGVFVMAEGTNQTFRVNANDPENYTPLNYVWVTNGITAKTGTSTNYTISTVIGDAGVWSLRCHVEDNLYKRTNSTVFAEWTVIISDDADGDGMPNAWEARYGLDPYNPADAAADTDSDHLSNLQEYLYNLIPTNADYDGDSLVDGWEILYGTNPTNREGVVDNINIQRKGSFKPGAGEAQDVFTTNGIAYLANGNGLYMVNVSTPTSPSLLGSNLMAGTVFEVAVRGTNAFVAAGTNGLVILNTSSPTNITRVGHFTGMGDCYGYGLDLAGSKVYLADGYNTFYVVDVSNPAAPSKDYLEIDDEGWAFDTRDLYVRGTNLYVSDFDAVLVYDLADPAAPYYQGMFITNNLQARDAFAVSSTVYVAGGPEGLLLLDASDRTNPVLESSLKSGLTGARDVEVLGNLAFAACGSDGLRVIDIYNPNAPRTVWSTNWPSVKVNGVFVRDTFIYAAAGTNGLVILQNISGDADGDGMPDLWELEHFGTTTNGAYGDFDNDGICNWGEFTAGLDPTNADQDNDGIIDGDEVRLYNTDPRRHDTDGDGMPDWWEIREREAGRPDPLVPDANDDLDSDGLPNIAEYQWNTDPNIPDTDGDFMNDGDEVNSGRDPTSARDGAHVYYDFDLPRPNGGVLISEYVEGTSHNKALEIFNGTPTNISLSGGQFVVQVYYDGNTSPGDTIALTGSLASGQTHVLAHSLASASLRSLANQTNGNLAFNGDDAVLLRSGGASGTILDSIGRRGEDPGTRWSSNGVSTLDSTLRRSSSVPFGDTAPDNAFDVSEEWISQPVDTFSGLGAHSILAVTNIFTRAVDTVAGVVMSASDFGTKTAAPTGAGGNPYWAANATNFPAGQWFTFTANLSNHYSMSVIRLGFDERRSAGGPTNWALYSSRDNYTAAIASGTTSTNWNRRINDLALAGVSNSVTFRLAASATTSASGDWRVDNVFIVGTNTALLNNRPVITMVWPKQEPVYLATNRNALALEAAVSDDVPGNPFNYVTSWWRQVSGPAQASIVNGAAKGTISAPLNSHAYFPVNGNYTLQALASDGLLAATSTTTVVVGHKPPGLVGMTGRYYNGTSFNTFVLQRSDPTISFYWNGSSPAPGVNGVNFSVVWTGMVRVAYSELYTFHTYTDDGARLWVNGQPLVDKWIGQSATEWSGSIALEAGRAYPIRLEYYQGAGQSVAELRWSSPSQAKQVIPAATGNISPVSYAGEDRTVVWHPLVVTQQLYGVRSDDGLPSGSVTSWWSQASPPSPTLPLTHRNQTNATIVVPQAPATYEYRFAAHDGSIKVFDPMNLRVSLDGYAIQVQETDGDTEVNEATPTVPDTYTVALNTVVTGNVQIAVITTNNQVTATPTNLLFTTANWNTPQTVEIRAVDDAVPEGTHFTPVRHRVVAAGTKDSNYIGLPVSNVLVRVLDNDKADISATPTNGLTTAER